MTLRLIIPSFELKKSFLKGLEEYKVNGEEYSFLTQSIDFDEHLQQITDHALGKNLPENWVPATTLWLAENEEWLGKINIRHSLTPHLLSQGGHIGYTLRPSARGKGFGTKMLERGLIEAKKISLDKVLITCDDKNIASARIIEKNGGVLENIVERQDGELEGIQEGKTRRYWITL